MSQILGGTHHIRYYSYVTNLFSDAKLWYFIKHAWEKVDDRMFYTRLFEQNFSLLDTSSRNGDKNSDYYAWTVGATRLLIEKLINRIIEVNALNDATQIN